MCLCDKFGDLGELKENLLVGMDKTVLHPSVTVVNTKVSRIGPSCEVETRGNPNLEDMAVWRIYRERP